MLRKLRELFHDDITSADERDRVARQTAAQKREAQEIAAKNMMARTTNHFGERIAASFADTNRRGGTP